MPWSGQLATTMVGAVICEKSSYLTAGSHEKDFMEWTILPGEVYEVHPMVRCKGYVAPFSMIGDMYLIGKDRTEWMTTALPGLPEIIP